MTYKASQRRWDEYFIDIADVVRQKSKDLSSKVGAVIVGRDKQIISTGFNGFPRGIDEEYLVRWERPVKYQFVVHAERNAIYNAARTGVSLSGCTLYLYAWGPPNVPCTECTKAVIQSGITRFVGKSQKTIPPNWVDDLKFAKALLEEAGVECVELE